MNKVGFGIIGIAVLIFAIPNAYSAEPDMITYLSIQKLLKLVSLLLSKV